MNVVNLNEVLLSLESGSRPKGGASLLDNGILSIGAQHLDREGGFNLSSPKFIPETYYSNMKTGIISKDIILIVKDGATTGKVSYVGCDFEKTKAAINEHLFLLRIDRKKALPKYVFYYLFSKKGQFQILKNFRGATVGGINRSFTKDISFPLPPIAEQKRIATILDKADTIRKKRQEAIKLTEELLRSQFLEMFGDPVINPKKFTIKYFADVGVLERGKSKHRPRNDPSLLGGIYPLIQTGDVANSGGIIQSYTQTYSEKGLSQSKMWTSGTLCITIAANIAQTGILTFDACFPDSIVGFHPNLEVTTEYIQGWLNFLQPILEEKAPQVAQKNINLKILRELPLPVPPIILQKKYSKFTNVIRKQINKNKEYSEQSDNLFNSLLQKAFKGEL